MDTLGRTFSSILTVWQNQLLGTFVAPQSSFSLGWLAITMVTAGCLVLRGRNRRVRTLIRALFPRRLWRSRSGRADMAWFAFSVGGAGLAFGWALIASPTIALATTSQLSQTFGNSRIVSVPGWAATAILTFASFLAYEFAYWLDHWAMHRFKWAWAFHQVHHSAESLSLLTLARVHPVETIGFYNLVALIMGATSGVLAYALGGQAAPLTIMGINALSMTCVVLIGHLQHSHLWVTFGPRWGKLLLGPAHHQIHHSVAAEHHDRNFGNILTLFDRLFGTFVMPEPTRQPIKFGIDAQHFDAQSLHGLTVQPFIDSFRALPFGGRACDAVAHARKRIAPGARLLRRDQPGGIYARDHEGGLAPRPRIARLP